MAGSTPLVVVCCLVLVSVTTTHGLPRSLSVLTGRTLESQAQVNGAKSNRFWSSLHGRRLLNGGNSACFDVFGLKLGFGDCNGATTTSGSFMDGSSWPWIADSSSFDSAFSTSAATGMTTTAPTTFTTITTHAPAIDTAILINGAGPWPPSAPAKDPIIPDKTGSTSVIMTAPSTPDVRAWPPGPAGQQAITPMGLTTDGSNNVIAIGRPATLCTSYDAEPCNTTSSAGATANATTMTDMAAASPSPNPLDTLLLANSSTGADNSSVLLDDSSTSTDNSSVLLANSSTGADNSSVLLANSSTGADNGSVLLDDSSIGTDNSSVLFANSSTIIDNSSLIFVPEPAPDEFTSTSNSTSIQTESSIPPPMPIPLPAAAPASASTGTLRPNATAVSAIRTQLPSTNSTAAAASSTPLPAP
eukprot:jgi/Chrzof1/1206/Cz01g44200.t1